MIEYRIDGKCRKFSEVPRGAKVVRIHGREVADICENCQYPIVYGSDNVEFYSDGVLTHKRCPKGTGLR